MDIKNLLLLIALIGFSFQSFGETSISSDYADLYEENGDCNWKDQHYDEYESGWGTWNDGGSDCYRNRSLFGGIFNWLFGKSNHSIRLRDNSGHHSSSYTKRLNFHNIARTKLEFAFNTTGFSHGEDFMLEYSLDDGHSWLLGKKWAKGIDFDNHKTHKVHSIIDAVFTAKTKFRLRCDASSNSDKVYIDNVKIMTCNNHVQSCHEKSVNFVNKGQCDIEIWDGSHKIKTIKSGHTFKHFGILGKIFKIKSAIFGSNWSKNYTVNDNCDQWHEADADCTPVCHEKSINFVNKGQCDIEIWDGSHKIKTIKSGHTFKHFGILGKIFKIKSAIFGSNWSRNYTVNDNCDQWHEANADCTPVCHEKSINFVNKGQCDIEIWDGSHKIKTIKSGHTFKHFGILGKIFKIKSAIFGSNWSKNYTVNDNCDQWHEADADCAPVTPPSDDCSWTDQHYDEYESGWGTWNDGGYDCYRNRSLFGGIFNWLFGKSNHSIRLRDNSGHHSSSYTKRLNFHNIARTKLEFAFNTTGFSHGEDFMLEYSLDDGHSWLLGKKWAKGFDFDNRKTHKVHSIIDAIFTAKTKFRFRCDASSNSDMVYIDNVRIMTCNSPTPNCSEKSVNFVNKGQCDIEIWDGSHKIKTIKSGHTFKHFGILGKIFKIKSAIFGSNWSKNYTVNDNCDQWHEADADCAPVCHEKSVNFVNKGQCDIEIWDGSHKIKTIKSGHTFKHFGILGKIFKIKSAIFGSNWSRNYTVNDNCDQWHEADADCAPVCHEKSVNFVNKGQCDIEIWDGSHKIKTIKSGHTFKHFGILGKIFKIKSAIFGSNWSKNYTVNDHCDQWHEADADCAPVCHEKSISFVNKGRCDIELWDGSHKIKTIKSGHTFKHFGILGKIFKIKSAIFGSNWSKNYTVNDKCDQWHEADADCTPVTPPSDDCSWTDQHYDEYESGWGTWNDGGSDCYRNRSLFGGIFNWLFGKSNHSIRLRDNSGHYSSSYTKRLNFHNIARTKLEFAFNTTGFSHGEDFMLEYSLDDGHSWSLGKKWVKGIDFDNRKTHKVHSIIDAVFTAKTRFRLRCDASSNSDMVYIDNVRIMTCGDNYGSAKGEDITESRSKVESKNLDFAISSEVYPNPANNFINFSTTDLEGSDAQIFIFNVSGKQVYSTRIDNVSDAVTKIDVSNQPEGMYFLRVTSSDGGEISKRFTIVH